MAAGETGPDGPALEELTREECLRLIAGPAVGRIAVCVAGQAPHVVPVNYVLDGDDVVFRTDPGLKLDAVGRGPATFEVDHVDPVHRSGWSVLVQGPLALLGGDETAGMAADPAPWAGGRKESWVRLVASSVTGRRIVLPDVPRDGRGYL